MTEGTSKTHHEREAAPVTEVVVWGCGGHALVAVELIRLCPLFHLRGILVDENGKSAMKRSLAPWYLGGREQLPVLRDAGVRSAFVAVGNNSVRLELADMLESAGFGFVNVIAQSAHVSPSASIGPGAFVGPNATVNTEAMIGRQAIINSSASVGHECRLEAGVHVASGAVLAGNVTVGRGAWIGAGAVVIQNLTVGAGTVVGAGSVVVRDQAEGVVTVGVPSRIRRAAASSHE